MTVIVKILEPSSGRVYDLCCGLGDVLVQTERFICDHGGSPTDVAIYGRESAEQTWRIAQMNLDNNDGVR
ncbi:N-6 DNA methylase [Mycobacterium leprae]|uniref:N-6 DNA methylase n=1 Tax=Mycobacterium leprae TaxID=1769 RepID=UPI0002E34D37